MSETLPGATPNSFKKDDFLSASDAAKKLGYSEEEVANAMKELRRTGKKITIKTSGNGSTGQRSMIYRFNGSKVSRVHPLGLDILKEFLDKQRG